MSDSADRKMKGILFACACYGMYSLHYATMKWLAQSYSLWMLIFLRSIGMFAITLALGRGRLVTAFLASRYRKPTAMRAVLQFGSATCFYVAANAMPLAVVTTVYSAAPVLIVILSIFMLGEKIHGFRWFAIALGLAGTAVASWPGRHALGTISVVPSLIALGSGLFWAFTVVFTRKAGTRESSTVQMVTTGLVFMALSIGFATWKAPASLLDAALMLMLGAQTYLAQFFFFESCRFAPASLLGPLEYSSVLWACLLGFLVFAEIPTMQVLIGALLVVLGGMVLALSATRHGQRPEDEEAMLEAAMVPVATD